MFISKKKLCSLAPVTAPVWLDSCRITPTALQLIPDHYVMTLLRQARTQQQNGSGFLCITMCHVKTGIDGGTRSLLVFLQNKPGLEPGVPASAGTRTVVFTVIVWSLPPWTQRGTVDNRMRLRAPELEDS